MHAAVRGFGCRGDAHAARLVEACSYVEEGRLHYVIARLGPQNPAHAARVRRRLVAHAAKQGPHHYRLFFLKRFTLGLRCCECYILPGTLPGTWPGTCRAALCPACRSCQQRPPPG